METLYTLKWRLYIHRNGEFINTEMETLYTQKWRLYKQKWRLYIHRNGDFIYTTTTRENSVQYSAGYKTTQYKNFF